MNWLPFKKRELIAMFLGWAAGGVAYFILPRLIGDPSIALILIFLIGFGVTITYLQICE